MRAKPEVRIGRPRQKRHRRVLKSACSRCARRRCQQVSDSRSHNASLPCDGAIVPIQSRARASKQTAAFGPVEILNARDRNCCDSARSLRRRACSRADRTLARKPLGRRQPAQKRVLPLNALQQIPIGVDSATLARVVVQRCREARCSRARIDSSSRLAHTPPGRPAAPSTAPPECSAREATLFGARGLQLQHAAAAPSPPCWTRAPECFGRRGFSTVGLLFHEVRRSVSATVGRFCRNSRRSLSNADAET